MAIVLDGTSGITTPNLTDSSLTSGRVVYAGTGGDLTGSSSLVFDGTNLGVLGGSVTTPAAKLHVVGTVRSSNGAGTLFSSLASDGIYATGTDLYLVASTGYSNIFYANNVERMRLPVANGLQTSTTISVGNATPSASGAGITFPATQSASSDANTLDDYEEGSFTVSLYGGTVTGTPITTTGSYIKVERLVYARWALDGFGRPSGASGAVYVGGLPFTIDSSNTSISHNPIGLFINGTGTGTSYNRGAQSLRDISSGGTVLKLQTNNNTSADVTDVQISDLGTSYNYLRCDFVYQTSS